MIADAAQRRRPWAALSNPNYRLWFGGMIVSQTGGWMQRTAQAWLVLQLTNSALALGIVTALQFGPILALSLLSGVVADRVNKRRLLFVVQAALMAQAVLLAWLVGTGRVELWHIYVIALGQGTAAAFDGPTRQAFVGEMVPREQLQSAVALNTSIFNGSRIVGPSIAGVLIATSGIAPAYAINAASYVAVLGALVLMDTTLLRPHARPAPAPVMQQLIDGLRYARNDPVLSLPLFVLFFIGTFGYNFNVILPLLARFTFDVGSVGFGAMNTAIGLGSLGGALLVASVAMPTASSLLLRAGIFSLLLAALALSPSYLVTLAILIPLGLFGIWFLAGTNAMLQLSSRPEYRGRIVSLYALLSAGTAPLGGAISGAMANTIGIRETIVVNAALCLVGVALGGLVFRRRRRRALLASPVEATPIAAVPIDTRPI